MSANNPWNLDRVLHITDHPGGRRICLKRVHLALSRNNRRYHLMIDEFDAAGRLTRTTGSTDDFLTLAEYRRRITQQVEIGAA